MPDDGVYTTKSDRTISSYALGARPTAGPSLTLGKAGIIRLDEGLAVAVVDDVCDREGARIFVSGVLPSGRGFSLPVAGNKQLTRASARVVELVLEGENRWLEVP
jgi:hypothetical protein